MSIAARKKIVHPLFLKSCEFITDGFWIDVFRNLAFNNCPQGIFIDNDMVLSRIKGKEFSLKFAEFLNDPRELYSKLRNILETKFTIPSKREHYENDQSLLATLRSEDVTKKRYVRDLAVESFVDDTLCNHSEKTRTSALSLINLGLYFKLIHTSDIKFTSSHHHQQQYQTLSTDEEKKEQSVASTKKKAMYVQ
jgi:hypothetical protein